MNNCWILLLLLIFPATSCFSQNGEERKWSQFESKKGDFYFYWGYNRTSYAKSDIHLKADDYNFVLEDVVATDLPSEFSSEYYNPLQLTIPQFNARFGYNISQKYAISIGWDHMKYRSKNGSQAIITGRIDESASAIYHGYYNHDKITMDNDQLVRMEHSDGFNIVNINLERSDQLYSNEKKNLTLMSVNGAGLGIAIPWTNSKIFGIRNDDRIHFSGLGVQIYSAAELNIIQRFFIRYTLQAGFANLWDIAIVPKGDNSAHAEQTIKYLERSVVLGYRFRVF